MVTQEDGSITSLEALQRRQKCETATQVEKDEQSHLVGNQINANENSSHPMPIPRSGSTSYVIDSKKQTKLGLDLAGKQISKTQQKKLAVFTPRPPPPKPTIPAGILIPDGEEDWLSFWDLSDGELERRVLREKRRKAAVRKALRVKQQSGKVERRAARDEKRRVYRELKLTWKIIKGW